MRITDASRDRIERIPITEVVQRFLGPPKKKSGKNWWWHSPFKSGDKTPSFSVNPEKDIWKDFADGGGGKSVRFVQVFENCRNYYEAIERIADEFGIDLEYIDDGTLDESQIGYQLNEECMNIWHAAFMDDEQALDWMIDRQLDLKSVEYFKIGIAREGALPGDYSLDELVKFGILVQPKDRGPYFPFKDRIIFPIRNPRGKVVGFTARALGGKKPKYINTKDTILFSKSDELYGLYENQHTIKKKGAWVQSEGPMDVIIPWQNGIRTVVAGCGTGFSRRQAHRLSRFGKRPYVVGDGDEAGQVACMRWAKEYLAEGMNPWIISLPPGLDLDDIAKLEGGREMMRSENHLFNLPQFASKMYLEAIEEENEEKALTWLNRYIDTLKASREQTSRIILLKKFCQLCGLDYEQEKRKLIPNRAKTSEKKEPVVQATFSVEEDLMCLMIHNPEKEKLDNIAQWIMLEDPTMQSSPNHDKLFQALYYEEMTHEEILNDTDIADLYTRLACTDPPEWEEKAIKDSCFMVFNMIIERNILTLKQLITKAEDPTEESALMDELNKLQSYVGADREDIARDILGQRVSQGEVATGQ